MIDTSQLPGRGIKPLLSLRNHYKVSIVLWLLVVLVGLPVVWVKGQSYYAAESVFQVSPNYMKNLSADKEVEFQSNSQYREFVNHLSATVTRYDVLQKALSILKASEHDVLPTGMTERKFIEKLQKLVYVRAIPDTYMVKVGMESQTKETLDEIVNAITTSFLETTKSEQIFGSGERLDVLEANSVKLREEVTQLEAQRVALAELLGLTTFGENTVNPYDAMLAQAREKLANASIEKAQAEATLQAFLKQGETPTAVGRSLMEMRLQDNGLQALRNEVVKRSEELGRVIAGLEDRHPAKKPAVAEYEAINKRLQSRESEFEKTAFSNVKSRLTASLRQTSDVQVQVKLSLKEIEGQAANFARNFQQAMRITSDIRKREQELKDVRDRLNYLNTERSAIGFARLVTPALAPETPRGVGKTKLLLGLLILASGLALAAPVALDLLDRRIYTVNDAEKLMGMPAAGWQVEMKDFPTRFFAAEQSKRFATTLLRNKTRSGQHAFAFTSVKSLGGVTTLILDTATVLKQLGQRVLVLDANSYSSSPVFSGLVPGLSEYLSGSVAIGDVLQSVNHRDESLPAVGFGGDRSSGVQRLDLLKIAIERWSTEFDFILIDLPPVLLSADAELLVDALGQVFLVLEAQSVTRGEVTRAKRVLEKLDPEAVGLFVNRIPMFQGGGYMHELIVETLTRNKFSHFMSLSNLKLQIEFWRTRRLQKRMGKSNRT